jgi:two-component system copper resistance phosphate regulon response regulator CusR
LQINLRTLRVVRGHRKLTLTRIEFLLLTRLAAAMGKVVGRHTLEKEVWEGKRLRSNSLEATIYRLRAKVDVPFRSKLIHTAPERGYWLARLT